MVLVGEVLVKTPKRTLVSLYGNLFPSSLPLRPIVALCDLCYRIGGNVEMRT